MKAGLKGSPEEKLISKEWFSLVRQHNKLRVALNKKMHAREKIAAEKFFAKTLINLQQNCLANLKILENLHFPKKKHNNTLKKHIEMSNATMFIPHHQNSSVLTYHLGCSPSAAQLKMS